MIITNYSGAESTLEPQLIVLGTETERILAALGMAYHSRDVARVMVSTEYAQHIGSWSFSWHEAVRHGTRAWAALRPRFTAAGLEDARRNGAPRENLARFGQAIATELGLPADDALVVLLAVAMIRREEFDSYTQEENAKGAHL
ncbi:DUF6187 family protein [Streptomyces sp. NBRC 110028]|uniref:DUF6187 family protein n=1 Tax=Streptomyces sp. NBRC 110028 TaxID=1621260 RepID=UPI0006E3584A|nr:DUF6187 family protein [Streptomyces sp. NBRC 110028]